MASAAGPILGTATVEIGGDLTKLFMSFDQARAARDAFDKDMVAGSNGLLAFSKAANDTGASLSGQAAKTGEAGAAARDTAAKVDQLAASNLKAAASSKTAADGLDAESRASKTLSDNLDREIARLAERDRVVAASRPPGWSLPQTGERESISAQNAAMGIGSKAQAGGADVAAGATAATAALKGQAQATDDLAGRSFNLLAAVDKNYASQAKYNKLLEEAQALYKAGALSEAEFALATNAINKGLEGTGTAIHGSSGVMREFIVMLREAFRGDFTRLSGSATILAQRLGAIEAIGAPLLAFFGLLAAAVGVVGYAMVKGSENAVAFDNAMALSGNRAGLTASNYVEMAAAIEKAAGGSISANEKLISSLAATNNFSKDQIQALVAAAQTLSKATGESAEDIVKDFERMAEGPTKYAEEFQRTHINIITPLQLQAIRELEERGQKEQATGLLIQDVTDGIAKNTEQNTNAIYNFWEHAKEGISDYFGWLMRVLSGTETDAEKMAGLNQQILNVKKNIASDGKSPWMPFGIQLPNNDPAELKSLEAQRDALAAKAAATAKATAASAEHAAETKRENDAMTTLHSTYGGLIDSQTRFTNDVAKLKQTLADAEKANPNDPLVKQLRDDLPAAIDKLKKQDLPAAFKADAKAASEAEAAAKRAAKAAEELEKRRQQAIGDATAEGDLLTKLLPLYENQALSLDDINRAKAIQIALSHQKLSADSAEGKALADAIGRMHDLNTAIEAETKKRGILDEMRAKDEGLQNEIKFVGQAGAALVYEQVKLDALTKAKKDHIVVDAAFLAQIERDAQAISKDTASLDLAKFIDASDQKFKAATRDLNQQTTALGLTREAAAAYAFEMERLNAAADAHITLSPQQIDAIHQEALAYGQQSEALEKLNEHMAANKWANQQLESSLEDVLFNGKSLVSTLGDLAKSFAKAAFEAALFGNGPLAGLFGTSQAGQGASGGGGGLLGSLLGLLGGGGGGGSGGGGGGLFGSIAGLFGGGGGGGDAASLFTTVFHSGTNYVSDFAGPQRAVAPSNFINAPRFHKGLDLGPDEFPAILERGEKVTPKGQAGRERGGTVVMNVYPRDLDSFRGSERQIARKTREAIR